MKIKFNILSIATAAMLGAGLSSCNDWLKVDMEDQVMENTLFSDYKGYRTALNGIYQTMIPLYTTNFGPNIDVMAQTYNVSLNNSHINRAADPVAATRQIMKSITQNNPK